MPGMTTYMKLPYTKNPENLDFIVAGVPFDTLTTARGGTRLGPEAIRGAYGNNVYNPDLKIQISDYLEVPITVIFPFSTEMPLRHLILSRNTLRDF